jgi:predicted glutamine amidotransferase
MCGIVGAMSSILSDAEKDAFKSLLNIASFRGRDGSGVATVSDTPYRKATADVRTLKSKLISSWLAYSPELEELMKKPTAIAVGHARWPTKGGVDLKSVHPHRSKHIVGVHNGTMFDICGEKVGDKQSDSAMFFDAIAEKGIEEAWKTSYGAAALVFIDEEQQTINFIRNSGRPLHFRHYGWQKNTSTMYWASEPQMLDFVMPRHFHTQNHWGTYLPENILFTYPLDVKHSIRPLRTQKMEKPRVISPPTNPHISYDPADAAWWELHGVDPSEDVDVPFERGGKFIKNVTPRHLNSVSEIASRADLARRRMAERMAERKTEEAAESRHNPPAPPFHMSGRDVSKGTNNCIGVDAAGNEVFADTKGKNLPAIRDQLAFPDMVTKKLRELNDDISDIGRIEIFAGRKCCWCGTPACSGDKVTPIYGSDLGDKEFICVDCVRNPSVIDSGFLNNNPEPIIVP